MSKERKCKKKSLPYEMQVALEYFCHRFSIEGDMSISTATIFVENYPFSGGMKSPRYYKNSFYKVRNYWRSERPAFTEYRKRLLEANSSWIITLSTAFETASIVNDMNKYISLVCENRINN